MSNKNLLSGRDKELLTLSENYEAARAEGKTIYLDADDWADLADWYAVRFKYEEALEVTIYGLSQHPGNTAILVEQAYLYIDLQDIDKAKETVDSITEDDSEVRILRASLLYREDKDEEAEALLKSVEENNLANLIDVCYMYLDMGLPEKALPWLERNTRFADQEAYISVSGDCYFALERFPEAIECYNKLIDRNPYSATFWYGLARCYFCQEEYDKAIDACDYAIVSDEEFADAYLIKGQSFYHLGNEEKSFENFLLADKYGAAPSELLNSFIGLSKTAVGDWEEAYKHLEKAIGIAATQFVDDGESPLPSFYVNAALCLFRMGKTEQAHQYCQKAYTISPTDAYAYLMEGRFYMEEGQFEQGIEVWKEALKCAPYAETWDTIGSYSMEVGQLENAAMAFERVKALDPDFDNINEKLTLLYLMLGNEENFQECNQLCKRPLEPEEVEQMQQMMKGRDHKDFIKIIQQFFASFDE